MLHSLTGRASGARTKKLRTYLVAFGDTEGVHGKNGLWSLTLLFVAVVQGPPALSPRAKIMPSLKLQGHCYHMLTYNGGGVDGVDAKLNRKALAAHVDTMHELKKQHEADGILVCFYNASHDKQQLEPYLGDLPVPDLNVQFVDMLKFVKTLIRVPKYGLGYLRYDVYGTELEQKMGQKQEHRSLHDTLDMIYVLHAVVLDSAAEQTRLIQRAVRREDRHKSISKANRTTAREVQIKRIVTHEFFLLGLLVQQSKSEPTTKRKKKTAQSPLPVERRVSLDFVKLDADQQAKAKYQYFTIDDVDYKVRSGFENSNSSWYKGYGLYERKGAQFKRILQKARKTAILDLIQTLDFTNETGVGAGNLAEKQIAAAASEEEKEERLLCFL